MQSNTVVEIMANLTLYREFYCISQTAQSSAYTYVLIAPVALSANTYVENSTTIVESIIVQNKSTGIYYVNLNPVLYSFDNIYELVWSVNYNLYSPTKKLITRFRLSPYNINSTIDVEIVSPSYGIDIETVPQSYGIDIEVLGRI